MIKNESGADRIVRAILGIVILYFVWGSPVGIAVVIGYIIGVILLVTALTGYCHLYKVLGISTAK